MDGFLPHRVSDLLEAPDSASRDAAWAAFLNEYSQLLLRAARRASSSYDETMDHYTFILDQLQVEDFRRLRAFAADGRGTFTTWLVVVTRRLCVDHYRRQYGRPQTGHDSETAQSTELAARRRLVDLVADKFDLERVEDVSTLRPDASVLDAERRRALEEAVGDLVLSDQLLLTLRFEDGIAVEKIAPMIGTPTRFHVYRRLNAVLAKLRAALEAKGITEP